LLIKNYPQTGEADTAHFFLGEASMQREEFQNAYLAWQNYLARLPDGEFASRATFRMGEATMRMKLFSQSIRILETFVNRYPTDPLMQFAMAYLGEMRLTRDEPQLAQRVFEESLRIDPSGHVANKSRFGLARSLQVQGSTIDALNFYDFIVREPGNPLAGPARLEAGIIHFAESSFDTARDLLSPVVDPEDPFDLTSDTETQSKAHYWLGRVALTRDDFRTALDHFRDIDFETVESDIAVAAWFDGSVGATRAGDHQQAEKWLANLIEAHPEHELIDDARFLQLRNAFEQNKESDVPELAEVFFTSHPESPFCNQVHELLGQLAYENERYEETVMRFTNLLETQPVEADDHDQQRLTWSYYAALGKIGLEQFQQAETILQSLASSSELPVENKAQSLSTLVQIALANTRFSQGKHELAIENYEAYLSIAGWDDQTVSSQHELLLCYAQAGRWKEARVTYERLSGPSDTANEGSQLSLIVSLALDAAEESEPEFWYAALKRAGTGKEDVEAVSLAELAWLKREQGDHETADDLFDELLQRFPTHPASAEAGIARAGRFEAESNFKMATAIYAQVASNFAGQESGSIAALRHAYALQKIGNRASLRQARTAIDVWIEKAAATASTAKQQLVLAEALYQSAWICEDLRDAAGRDLRFEELVEHHQASKYWPDAAYRIARKRVNERDFRSATALIQSLQQNESAPARIVARADFLLGQVHAKQQRWQDAEVVFGEVNRQTTDKKLKNKSRYWLAESLYRQDKFAKAGTLFAELHQQPVRELSSLRPWILLRSIQCQAKAESWQDAAALAKAAIKEFPSFSLVHEYQFFVARGLEDEGLLNDAIAGYQQVIDSPRGGSSETAAIAQWRIGEVCFHQEDYAAAIQAYHRVDSIYGYPQWRSAALLQAGKCQEHLKNWKHAEKLYRQLLKSFPDNELATDAQDRLTLLQSVAAKNTLDKKTPNHTTR
jgi:TolA-binding protein